MKLKYVCSSGFVLFTAKGGLAVDAPNGLCDPYRAMERGEAERLSRCRGEYKNIEALLFTHSHPDHRDMTLSRTFAELNKAVFEAGADYPDHGFFGGKDWKAEFFKIAHSGAEFQMVPHYTFLITAEGKQLYFAGDGEYEEGSQCKALQGKKIDIAVFNPIVTFSEKNLETMEKIAAKQTLICHLPEDESHGICQKALVCKKRYENRLQGCIYLTHCPVSISL